MKYWLYQDRNIFGPYDWKELSAVPGFSGESLVCPEGRFGTQKEDWRKAGTVEGLVESVVEQSRLRAAIGGVRDRVDSLEKTRGELEIQLQARLAEIATLHSVLKEKDEKIGELSGKIERLFGALSALDERLETGLKENASDVREAASRLEAETASGLTEVKREVSEVRSEIREEASRLREETATGLEAVKTELTAKTDKIGNDLRESASGARSEVREEASRLRRETASGLEAVKAELGDKTDKLGAVLTESVSGVRSEVSSGTAGLGRDLAGLREEMTLRMEDYLGGIRGGLVRLVDDFGRFRKARARQALGLAASAGLAAWAFFAVFDRLPEKTPPPPPVARLASPSSNLSALVWREGNLWGLDWAKGTLYRMGMSDDVLTVLSRTDLAGGRLTGLAVSDEFLFLCDAENGTIERRRLDGRFSLEGRVPSPGPSPSALYWDGRYLWSADSALGKIYRHLPDDFLTPLDAYDAPGSAPAALAGDGVFLWSADAETRRLYRHQFDGSLSVLDSSSVEGFEEGARPLSAFAWKNGKAWLAREGVSDLFVADRRSLKPPSK